MKAIILAGGYSKRLWPLTTEIPKSFLEFNGKPVIDHIMEKIDAVKDISEVIVSTNKKFEYFFVYWKQRSKYKTPIKLIIEDTIHQEKKLGAIGAINFVLNREKINGNFLLVSGDNLFEFDLAEFVSYFKKMQKVCIAVKDIKLQSQIRKLGVVSLNSRKKVVDFTEKPIDTKSTLVCSGVYAFPKKSRQMIKQYIQEGNFPDATGFLLEWMIKKKIDIFAWLFKEPWFDIGTHQSFDEAKKYYHDLKGTVLVTGGAGYLGHHVTEELLNDGYNVKVMDLLLYGFEPDERADFILGDIRNERDVAKAMEGVDHVVHLAALSNDPSVDVSPDKGIEINYNAMKTVATTAKKMGVKRFIFPSSCSVYGAGAKSRVTEKDKTNPLTLYAHTKLASENFLRELADDRFDVCLLRFATLFGHSKNMRFDLVANVIPLEAVEGEIKLFGGSQSRPLLHVNDAARAILLAIKHSAPFHGDVFNIGDQGQNYNIRDLTYLIRQKIFPNIGIREIPENVDQRSYAVNFTKAKEKLGFEVKTGIVKGVSEIAEKLLDHDYGNPRDDKYFRVKHLINKKIKL